MNHLNEQTQGIADSITEASHRPGIQWNRVTWYSWSLAIIIFLLVLPGVTFYIGMKYQETKDEPALLAGGVGGLLPPMHHTLPVACTMEAKICPDGSAVGRTGPQCEFSACPDSSDATSTDPSLTGTVNIGRSGISGKATLGPTCPVMSNPPDPRCADKPYQGTFTITDAGTGKTIKTFITTAAGDFNISVPAGAYTVALLKSKVMPSMAPQSVKVTSGASTVIELSIDTGIR